METEKELINIIRCYLKGEDKTSLDCDINELYFLSNKLNVSCIVAYICKNIISDKRFENILYKSIVNYERINKVVNNINDVFVNNNINYVILKGVSISKYYKEPYLRYSADLDIIVNEKDYLNASNILKKYIGFKCFKHSIHEDCFINDVNVNLDLHKKILFVNQYEKCIDINSTNEHELDNDNKYLHFLAHCAQHFLQGQLDLRFFIDLFYLRGQINRDFVNSKLKEYDLFYFDQALNSYLDAILNNKYSDLDKKLEEYVFSYAKDKGAKNRVVINNNNKKRYMFKRIFPSISVMKGSFPILNNLIFVLPFCYIIRIFKIIFSPRRDYAFAELSSNFKGYSYNADLANLLSNKK